MHPDRSDACLVEAARDGDKAAFAELIHRHYPLLLALCRRALGNPVLAEDAAQEAALQAVLSIDRLRRGDRFGPWLVAIGLNMCHRLKRQRARDAWSWDAVFGGRLVERPVEPGPGPDVLAEAAELRARVREAIGALPSGQREAILHYYLAELTVAETAAQLGIGAGAVKTRLHKARRSLRRRLEQTGKESTMSKNVSRRTVAKAAGALGAAAAVGKLSQVGAAESASMVEMRVRDVRRHRSADGGDYKHVCLLEEVGGERELPIWMGEFETTAIALQLEGVATPRPMAYAFAAGLLEATGGRLREVRISRLEDQVFYAEAVVESAEGVVTVDARPSDALNLALLAGAPVLVEIAVLAEPAPAEAWDAEAVEDAAGLAAQAVEKWVVPRSDR